MYLVSYYTCKWEYQPQRFNYSKNMSYAIYTLEAMLVVTVNYTKFS